MREEFAGIPWHRYIPATRIYLTGNPWANADFFDKLGSSGGAAKVGKTAHHAPFVAALTTWDGRYRLDAHEKSHGAPHDRA